MGAERLSMRKTREILRQKWELRRSHREVEQSLSVGLGTVSDVVHRARRAGLGWAQVHTLAEDALEGRMCRPGEARGARRPRPDCHYLHRARMKPGVTLALPH